jgi:hypothetical protein
MLKLIIMLAVNNEPKECHLRIPPTVADQIPLEQLERGIGHVFEALDGIEVLSIEHMEEIRHAYGRRAEDREPRFQ